MSSSLPRKASFLITVRRPLFVGVLLLEVFGLAVFVVEPLALERAGAAVADEGLRFVAAEKRVGRVVFFVDRDARAVGGFSASSSGVEGSVILFEGSWAKERFSSRSCSRHSRYHSWVFSFSSMSSLHSHSSPSFFD